jgi:hypothetical protein
MAVPRTPRRVPAAALSCLAVQAKAGGQMGLWLGRCGLGRALGLGPVGMDRICFIAIFFSVQKQIQEIPGNAYKA